MTTKIINSYPPYNEADTLSILEKGAFLGFKVHKLLKEFEAKKKDKEPLQMKREGNIITIERYHKKPIIVNLETIGHSSKKRSFSRLKHRFKGTFSNNNYHDRLQELTKALAPPTRTIIQETNKTSSSSRSSSRSTDASEEATFIEEPISSLPSKEMDLENSPFCLLAKSQGFLKEGDDVERNGKLYNYGETQGSHDTRKAAGILVKTDPELFSPDRLRELQSLNEPLYRILQFKRITHTFPFFGSIEFPNNYQFSAEGYSEAFVLGEQISSFKKYMDLGGAEKAGLHDWTPHDTERVLEVLQSFLLEFYDENEFTQALTTMNKKSKEDLVGFATGSTWHVTFGFYLEDYFIHANRGAGAKAFGFETFKNLIPGPYHEEALAALANRHTIFEMTDIRDFFADRGWDHAATELMPSQGGANCSKASLQAALKFLLSWRYYCKSDDKSKMPGDFCSKTNQLYENWNHFDQTLVLEDLFVDLEKIKNGNLESEYKAPIIELYNELKKTFNRELTIGDRIRGVTEIKRPISDELYNRFMSYDSMLNP